MVNMQNYKPVKNITKDMLKENNFRNIDGYYSYRFPVYSYKKDPLLWATFYIDLDNFNCSINVTDNNGNTYAAYYNTVYGQNNKVVDIINKRIETQLSVFIKNKLIKQKKANNKLNKNKNR